MPDTNAVPVLELGQRVYIKRHGAAVITGLPPADPSHPYHGRYQVTYEDTGKIYHARPGTLKQHVDPPHRVLVCETTKHYRAAALLYALPTDVVLEVGCSEGVTTDILHRRCQWVLGIDKNLEPVTLAQQKYPHCRLEQVDGFDLDVLRAKSPSGTYDKIFIDIGGIAQLHVVMSLLGLYYRSFRGAYIIVKSKFLKNMLGHTKVWKPPGLLPKGTQAGTLPAQPPMPGDRHPHHSSDQAGSDGADSSSEQEDAPPVELSQQLLEGLHVAGERQGQQQGADGLLKGP